ncbi:MAG TPA: hypothetical protein VM802_18180 [Chitinophaga sp.]|uniref:hypothetical protein n=1 Tax=Chitinophaga sp. TaxID=1869181 RepID=UPI002BE13BE6|nr:hypothetical protein [Chitinophaga sp.]HVI46813.1 hypothetical protein [Chitinophaga sp.]
MKQDKDNLLLWKIFSTAGITILVLLLSLLITLLSIGKLGIDIHFSDTYYVISRQAAFVIISLLLISFVFAALAIRTKFRQRAYLYMMILVLLADAYIVIRWFLLVQDVRNLTHSAGL